MVITFPHLGNAYITAKALLDDVGAKYVIPPFNNKKALEIGTKYAPEMACLPLKINLGNCIQGYEMGADTVLITGGRGPCRFGYYCEMEREILKEAGYEMDVIALEAPDGDVKELLRRIKRIAGGFNIYKIGKAVKNAVQISIMVDDIERLTYWTRPREKTKGLTDKIYKEFRLKAREAEGSSNIKKLLRETKEKLLSIEVNKDFVPMKVGIVGEIYTTIDDYTNMDIAQKLGNAGIEVHREVTISEWVVEHMVKPALGLPRDLRYAKAAKPYLGRMIGGHALETIGHTVMYANEDFDGIIQIYPLNCMPEIVAESILPSIERDRGIPVLTLIIDEMTGEAGYMTRVEAFIDLLEKRRERKLVEQKWLLSGN